MTTRIALRKFARNSRTLLFTSVAAGLYTLGCWMQRKAAKPKRPEDPTAGLLYDMQQYVDLAVANHCIKYQLLKDNAGDKRIPCPTRDEYDLEMQFPPGFQAGDEVNGTELDYICNAINHNASRMVELMQHDQRLVVNYLRLRYWVHWHEEHNR